MLQVLNLTKVYRQTVALEGFTFQASPGEIVALLGRNGAGKSTSFLCMSGLVRPTGGQILFQQELLGAQRARILALIPETPEIYDALTVWEHLVFTALSCEVTSGWEARANALLERFDLGSHRDALGITLSKGMRQKTLVAATLLADPPVLLFDEPMIGLDPAGQRELREIILDLSARGKTILISTHVLSTVQALTNRILILKKGRCIYDGDVVGLPKKAGEDIESTFLRMTA